MQYNPDRKSRRFVPALAALLFCFAILPSCQPGPKPNAKLEDVLAVEKSENRGIKEINNTLFTSMASAPKTQDYILGEGDLVQISVFEAGDLKTESRVSARGAVSLPLLGAVEVKDLSVLEAEQRIEELYRAKYLRDPHVSVFLKEAVSGKVTLMGCVKKPGTYDHLRRQRLMDVLASAEGLSEKAGKTVMVRRRDPDKGGAPVTYIVDLEALLKDGKSELNLEIKRGDVIHVPEAGMVYVDGAVKKPGNLPILQKMSVQEAIVTAGGFTKTADLGDIKLVRVGPDGDRKVIKLKASDVSPTSGNILLVKDRDIIYVETNGVKSFFYGVSFNFLGTGGSYSPKD